jgi:hypothetical protein
MPEKERPKGSDGATATEICRIVDNPLRPTADVVVKRFRGEGEPICSGYVRDYGMAFHLRGIVRYREYDGEVIEAGSPRFIIRLHLGDPKAGDQEPYLHVEMRDDLQGGVHERDILSNVFRGSHPFGYDKDHEVVEAYRNQAIFSRGLAFESGAMAGLTKDDCDALIGAYNDPDPKAAFEKVVMTLVGRLSDELLTGRFGGFGPYSEERRSRQNAAVLSLNSLLARLANGAVRVNLEGSE